MQHFLLILDISLLSPPFFMTVIKLSLATSLLYVTAFVLGLVLLRGPRVKAFSIKFTVKQHVLMISYIGPKSLYHEVVTLISPGGKKVYFVIFS